MSIMVLKQPISRKKIMYVFICPQNPSVKGAFISPEIRQNSRTAVWKLTPQNNFMNG